VPQTTLVWDMAPFGTSCSCPACEAARAGETIGFFLDDVDGLEVDYPNLSKFARAALEFSVYIASNTGSLINYGDGQQ
jgi:hypothetical protein